MKDKTIEKLFFVALSIIVATLYYTIVKLGFDIAWWFGAILMALFPTVFILTIYEMLD